MICSNCGNEISDNAKFCDRCGSKTKISSKHNKLKSTQKVCNRCGNTISKDAVFCYKCGNNTENNNAPTDDVSQELLGDITPNTEEGTCNLPNSKARSKTNKKGARSKIFKILGIITIIVLIILIFIAILIMIIATNSSSSTSLKEIIESTFETDGNEIQLTKTYTNRDEGIHFNYPESWKQDNDWLSNPDNLVYLLSPLDGTSFRAMTVDKTELVGDVSEIYDYETFIKEALLEIGFESKEVIYTKIDGVDAIEVTSEQKYNYITVVYAYIVNDTIYKIIIYKPVDILDEIEPIFDAVIESYKITRPLESVYQEQNYDDYGLSEKEALEVAQQFIDTHPLYERTVTGDVEYEPEDYDYSTKGMYKINLRTKDGGDRIMWVDKRTGSVFFSLDGANLITGEEFYDVMFLSAQKRDLILFDGINISDYLGSSIDDIYDDFGTPSYGTYFTGKVYTIGSYIGYGGIDFVYDEDTRSIEYIVGEPVLFTYKGVTLDKSPDELVELLGKPSYETPIENTTQKIDGYTLKFSMGSYTLRFDFKNQYLDTDKIILYYE